MEKEIVKIKTYKGRIITLAVNEKSDTHISGIDKFGEPVILPLAEIDRMLPIARGDAV